MMIMRIYFNNNNNNDNYNIYPGILPPMQFFLMSLSRLLQLLEA